MITYAKQQKAQETLILKPTQKPWIVTSPPKERPGTYKRQ